MAAVLSVIVLGDESGYEMGDVQKTKLAAIEAEWETQPAPAAFTLFGIPDQEEETNKFAIQIPLRAGHHCNAFRGYSSYRSERTDGAA